MFVYHADSSDDTSNKRFLVMERKLFAIMTIGAILTAVFGIWLLLDYAWVTYKDTGWLITKLLLVGGLVIFHLYCYRLMQEFRSGTARHGHVFYRWINEIPALLLVAIVLLAVAKPF